MHHDQALGLHTRAQYIRRSSQRLALSLGPYPPARFYLLLAFDSPPFLSQIIYQRRMKKRMPRLGPARLPRPRLSGLHGFHMRGHTVTVG